MKKLMTFLLTAVIICLLACAEDGDAGPQGEQGSQGEQGEQGPAGTDGKDGNTTDFYFQQGFKGYEGAKDVIIYSDNRDPNFSANTLAITNIGSVELISVLRFDDLNQTFNAEFGNDDWLINEAVLYLNGFFMFTNQEVADLQINLLDSVAPLFDQTVVTFQTANASENWSDPFGPSPTLSYPFSYPRSIRANPSIIGETFALRLSRSIVERWTKNAATNKGIVLEIIFNSADCTFFSSEEDITELRPMLYINAEHIESHNSGRKRHLSEEEYLAAWDAMTLEEKMEPYYRKK